MFAGMKKLAKTNHPVQKNFTENKNMKINLKPAILREFRLQN